MAAKKHKPALIELVDKDKLSPPGWFYGRKRARFEQMRKDASVTQPTEPQEQAATVEPWEDMPETESPATPAPQPQQHASITFARRTLTLTISYWLLPIIAMALMLTLLIAYRLGRPSDSPADSQSASLVGQTPVSSTVPDSPGRTGSADSLPTDKNKSKNAATAKNTAKSTAKIPAPATRTPDLRAIPKAPIGKTAPVGTLLPRTGQCLIMCNHQDKALLEPVRDYFNANRVPAVIGRFGGSFVLVSSDTVKSGRSTKAAAFANRVAELGSKGPADFAAAFKTMYWVSASRIKF